MTESNAECGRRNRAKYAKILQNQTKGSKSASRGQQLTTLENSRSDWRSVIKCESSFAKMGKQKLGAVSSFGIFHISFEHVGEKKNDWFEWLKRPDWKMIKVSHSFFIRGKQSLKSNTAVKLNWSTTHNANVNTKWWWSWSSVHSWSRATPKFHRFRLLLCIWCVTAKVIQSPSKIGGSIRRLLL